MHDDVVESLQRRSRSARAASVRVTTMPMPRKSANTITASMSPSAIALTTLLGTSWTRKSTPVAPAARAPGAGGDARAVSWRAARATARRRDGRC